MQEIAQEMSRRVEGQTLPVLVESVNEQDSALVTGRLSNNLLVHFPGDENLIGKIVNVYLKECRDFTIWVKGDNMAQLTPMMQQYMQTKKEYQDCILFYRLGDFYEMFFEDALTASKELEITLTGKDCGLEERGAHVRRPVSCRGLLSE